MEIILKQDVENLGHKNQIVNVKPGYANNFLIPRGMASAATASAKKVLAETIKQQAHKEAKIVADATKVAEKMSAVAIEIGTKTSVKGRLFGAVTTALVAEALAAKGFEIDKRDIKLDAIKEVGTYKALVKIYRDIRAEVILNIISNSVEVDPNEVEDIVVAKAPKAKKAEVTEVAAAEETPATEEAAE